MAAEENAHFKPSIFSADAETRQQSNSTVASFLSSERLDSLDNYFSSCDSLRLANLAICQHPQQQQQEAGATAAGTEAAAASLAAPADQFLLHRTASEKDGFCRGNPTEGPLGETLESYMGLIRGQSCPSLKLEAFVGAGSSSTSSYSAAAAASSLRPTPAVLVSSPLDVLSPLSSSSKEWVAALNSSSTQQHQQQQQLQLLQVQQQLQEQQPLSCIVTEGCSGEVAYLEFVSEASPAGLQLLAKARRERSTGSLLRVAATAFNCSAAAAAESSQNAGIVVQQLKPLLRHSPLLVAARERGLGEASTSSSNTSSRDSPQCWVVGWGELLRGFFPAWSSLDPESIDILRSSFSHAIWLSFLHLLDASQSSSLLPHILQTLNTNTRGESRSLRQRLGQALRTLQGLRTELEDHHQALAKMRFLRSSSNRNDPQETLASIANCYLGISSLMMETHAAADGMLQQVRNGKQLQQELQQQQQHFAAALGRIDAFGHSLQQLQQLAREEEKQLQLQQKQKQQAWLLMDQWSRGEIELQQQLLRTVLGFAAEDARHLDALRDAWIQLTCLCSLPPQQDHKETARAASFTGISAAPAAAAAGEGTLPERIGFTEQKAPRLLLLCLMLEAEELAAWVLSWLEASQPLAAATGGDNSAAASPNSIVSPLAAAGDTKLALESLLYTPQLQALLRRRLLRLRARSHLAACSSSSNRKASNKERMSRHHMPHSTHRRSSASSSSEDLPLQEPNAAANQPAEKREGRSRRKETAGAAAVGMCPSPVRRRGSRSDSQLSFDFGEQQQQQQQLPAPAACSRSPYIPASTVMEMIRPLLVSDEETQLEEQVRRHDMLLQRQRKQQQQKLQEQHLLKHQQELQQQHLLQQQQGSMLPRIPWVIPNPSPTLLSLSQQLLKQQQEQVLLQQQEQLLQQQQQLYRQLFKHRGSLQKAPLPAAATTAKGEGRRRRSVSPKRLDKHLQQQQATVFVAALPKGKGPRMRPSSSPSSESAVSEELLTQQQQQQQQHIPTAAAAAAAARNRRSVFGKCSARAPCGDNPPQWQQQNLRTQQSAPELGHQQQHQQEPQQKLQKQQQQQDSPYTAFGVKTPLEEVLRRIFGGVDEDTVDTQQRCAAAAAAVAIPAAAAPRQKEGALSISERRVLAEQLKQLAQQLQRDDNCGTPQQQQQEQQQQQQQRQQRKPSPPKRRNSSNRGEGSLPLAQPQPFQQQGHISSSKRDSANSPLRMTQISHQTATTASRLAAEKTSRRLATDTTQQQYDSSQEKIVWSGAAAAATAPARKHSLPAPAAQQQLKVLNVLDELLQQIESSQGLSAVPSSGAATAAARSTISFFSQETPETHTAEQHFDGVHKSFRVSVHPKSAAAAATGGAPQRSASTNVRRTAATAARVAAAAERKQKSRASAVSLREAVPQREKLLNASLPSSSFSESCSSSRSGSYPPQQTRAAAARTTAAASATTAAAAAKEAVATAAQLQRDRPSAGLHRRLHDPFCDAVLQLLQGEQQQQRGMRKILRYSAADRAQQEETDDATWPLSAPLVEEQSPQKQQQFAHEAPAAAASGSQVTAADTAAEAVAAVAALEAAAVAEGIVAKQQTTFAVPLQEASAANEEEKEEALQRLSPREISCSAPISGITAAAAAAREIVASPATTTASAAQTLTAAPATLAMKKPTAKQQDKAGDPSKRKQMLSSKPIPRGSSKQPSAAPEAATAVAAGPSQTVSKEEVREEGESVKRQQAPPHRRLLQQKEQQQQKQQHHQQEQQKQTQQRKATAAVARTAHIGTAATASNSEQTLQLQQEQRRQRQLLLLQQKQRLRQLRLLQQEQQLTPFEALKLRRNKVKEMALQQRMKANGLAMKMQEPPEGSEMAATPKRSSSSRASIKELLRRRDERLMAFVRQQLLLPEETAAADSEAEAIQSLIVGPQKTQPNFVHLTHKQRRMLLETTGARSSKQQQEQQQQQQQQEEGRTARGTGEPVSLDLQLQVYQEPPLPLSARSGGPVAAASAAAAAAIANPPEPPAFLCSKSEASIPRQEKQQQRQQESQVDVAVDRAEPPSERISLIPALQDSTAYSISPRLLSAAAATTFAAAAAQTDQRLEAVTQCAERVKEAMQLESKISALLAQAQSSSNSSNSSSSSNSSNSSNSNRNRFEELKLPGGTTLIQQPSTSRHHRQLTPRQLQQSSSSRTTSDCGSVTPRQASGAGGGRVFSSVQQQLKRQELQQQQQQQQSAGQPRRSSVCVVPSLSSPRASLREPEGLSQGSLCLSCTTPKESFSNSRKAWGALTAPGMSVHPEAAAAVGSLTERQNERVIVRLSLNTLATQSLSFRSSNSGVSSAHGEVQKHPSGQQQQVPYSTKPFLLQSPGAAATANSDRQQQHQQQQESVPLTPKGSIFRTAISRGSGSVAFCCPERSSDVAAATQAAVTAEERLTACDKARKAPSEMSKGSFKVAARLTSFGVARSSRTTGGTQLAASCSTNTNSSTDAQRTARGFLFGEELSPQSSGEETPEQEQELLQIKEELETSLESWAFSAP